MQPRIKVDITARPPKQQPTSETEIDAGPDEIAEAQVGDRFEPRYDCEAKGKPEEQHYGNENRSYETHCFTDTLCCTNEIQRRCRSRLNRTRPRLRPRAASTAQRPAKFSSSSPPTAGVAPRVVGPHHASREIVACETP